MNILRRTWRWNWNYVKTKCNEMNCFLLQRNWKVEGAGSVLWLDWGHRDRERERRWRSQSNCRATNVVWWCWTHCTIEIIMWKCPSRQFPPQWKHPDTESSLNGTKTPSPLSLRSCSAECFVPCRCRCYNAWETTAWRWAIRERTTSQCRADR